MEKKDGPHVDKKDMKKDGVTDFQDTILIHFDKKCTTGSSIVKDLLENHMFTNCKIDLDLRIVEASYINPKIACKVLMFMRSLNKYFVIYKTVKTEIEEKMSPKEYTVVKNNTKFSKKVKSTLPANTIKTGQVDEKLSPKVQTRKEKKCNNQTNHNNETISNNITPLMKVPHKEKVNKEKKKGFDMSKANILYIYGFKNDLKYGQIQNILRPFSCFYIKMIDGSTPHANAFFQTKQKLNFAFNEVKTKLFMMSKTKIPITLEEKNQQKSSKKNIKKGSDAVNHSKEICNDSRHDSDELNEEERRIFEKFTCADSVDYWEPIS